MVQVFNTENIKDMTPEQEQQIIDEGVPISIYKQGLMELGPSNKSALRRFANICTTISLKQLPIPPSQFVEFVAKRTTGKSKQDFTAIVDAKKGYGKSYSSAYLAARYAMQIAYQFDQNPKDYFTLENCALLEDTEGITKILDEADKQQAIIIDDAGTAVGSRDFAQQKNKNFNKILATCRTKRWFVILNVPISSHIDVQIRELIDANIHIYKPFHEAGFNLLKINSSESLFKFGKKKVIEKRFSFLGKKFDFWCAFNPDVLDPFKGFTDKYDKQRDDAANRIISDITVQEKDRGNPMTKQEKKRQEAVQKHGKTIQMMFERGDSARKMTAATGLTDHMINIVKAEMGIKND